MSAGFRFLAALAGVHAIGGAILSLVPSERRRGLPLFPATGLAGVLVLGTEMFALSAVGVRWTLPRLLILPAAATLVAAARFQHRPPAPKPSVRPRSTLLLLVAAGVVAIVGYAALTGRATSVDLLLFWGGKAERFALAGGIDVAYLRDPNLYLAHPDYPPLLPCLEAFGTLVAGRFPWGASLAVMPWFLAMAVAAFHAAARRRLGDETVAGWLTAILAAVVGLAATMTFTAGNADLPLIAFEVAALALVSAADGMPSWAAGSALAGAALLKIEGLFFAILVAAAAAFAARRRQRARVFLSLATPPAVAMAAWWAFCARNGLVDLYRGGKIGPFTFAHVGKIPSAVLRAAAYDTAYVPWIAVGLAALALRRQGFARFPLLVAGGLLGVMVYVYMHGPDPTVWIGWSAGRLLLTILVCAMFSIGGSGRSIDVSDLE